MLDLVLSIIHYHLFRQCGVHDPSWTEMRHFIWFLDTQIKSSEHSIFCNESVVGDVMSGFKTFVVKFMIRMSKVHHQPGNVHVFMCLKPRITY